MKFLREKLNNERSEADGTEVLTDPQGGLTMRVNEETGRAVLEARGREIELVRDTRGNWVPERHNWRGLAEILDAPALARAVLGF